MLTRLRRLFRKDASADDIAEEIATHIDMRAAHNIAQGMTPREARRAAEQSFGNVTHLREQTQSVWIPRWFDILQRDLRYAVTSLRRAWGFAAIVIATIAIAIGLNIAGFSVVEAILFRALPYPSAERLLWIAPYDRNFESDRDNRISGSDYLELSKRTRTFRQIAAYGNQDLALTFRGVPSQERIASVTGGFWPLTAAPIEVGRLFQPSESHVLVLSHALYERRFHADPAILGQTITIEGYPFTVIGVLAPSYRFLLPQQSFFGDEPRDIDAYIPVPQATLLLPPMGRSAWEELVRQVGPAPTSLNVFAKMEEGVTLVQADAELQTLVHAIEQHHTADRKVFDRFTGWRVVTLNERITGSVRRPFTILGIAVVFILLIACCNVANLLLSRAFQRRRELAIRLSLGAGKFSIARQFLVESLLLATTGSLLGIALAASSLRVLRALWPQTIPRLTDAMLDLPALAVACALCFFTAIVFGLVPAWSGWHVSPTSALQEQGNAIAGGVRGAKVRRALITLELALAVVLLVCTGLLLKSFQKMNEHPAGFTPERIISMRVSLDAARYPDFPAQEQYIQNATTKLLQQPGVERVGLSGQSLHTQVRIDGLPQPADSVASVRAVSLGYLRAMGISLVAGQWPSEGEFEHAVLVNESFARAFGHGANIVGMHLHASYLSGSIAGVVADFRNAQSDAPAVPEVFGTYRLAPTVVPWTVRMYARVADNGKQLPQNLAQTLSSIDPSQSVFDVQTLEQALSDSIAPRRFLLFLMSAFAGVALTMAVVGLYGIISYSVSQRRHEIGIRMALGATRVDVAHMVLSEGIRLVSTGLLLGALLAYAATRLLENQLYHVATTDPVTFAGVVGVLVFTSLLASVAPALRAALVQPQIALRHN